MKIISKRYLLLFVMTMIVAMPTFGQRFTKREQALREARAINYFYGNSFTLSSGYVHGWLSTDRFTNAEYGRTGLWGNTRESFSFSFAWDICKSKHYGYQFAASYTQFGGQKVFYADQGMGYGPQLRNDLTEQIHINEVMLHASYRYFIPLTYKSRLSLNAGVYLGRTVGKYDDAQDWDMGVTVGLGYDWRFLSASLIYKPGIYTNVIEHSDASINALMLNVGVRMWK